MTYLLVSIVIIYAAFAGSMYVFQRNLMYMPDTKIEKPEHYGLIGFEDIRLRTSDGISVQAWYAEAAPGFPTICYYHGNASHIGNRAGKFAAFVDKGFGVLALSYRGYGKSEGSPFEDGLYNDARAALQYLTETKRIPYNQIILFGESLGTGVAVQMASEHNVAALVLEAPYTSVVNRAAEIYYYVPVRLLIKDHYDSIGKIARVKAPVLIFHGDLDQTIPVAHGKALLDAAPGTKRAYFFPQVAHNDFDSRLLSEHVLAFAKEHRILTQ